MGDDAISTTQVVSQPPQSVVIETPRLIISDFTPEDLEPIKGIFKNLHSSGQTWFNADINRPNTIGSFLQMILDNQKDTPRDTYRLAIRRKDEDGRIRLIGYVSMCEIFSDDVGKPDTGVLIDPQLQKSGYAREARIAQNFFGFGLGIKKLACCIKPSNIPSINNVLGMGYSRVMLKDNSPLVVKTDTIRGVISLLLPESIFSV